jgi:cell division FtsZ-interacting protein ZapD
LVEQYETTFNNRIESAMKDVWDRVHDTLTHMSDRLADADDGSRKTFHKTLLTNASEMLDLMQKLNITKDPQLEAARQELSKALLGVELDDLKESTHTRKHVKTQVDEILSKFEW